MNYVSINKEILTTFVVLKFPWHVIKHGFNLAFTYQVYISNKRHTLFLESLTI